MVDILLQSIYEALVPLPENETKDFSPLIRFYFHSLVALQVAQFHSLGHFLVLNPTDAIFVEPGNNHESFSGTSEAKHFRSGRKESQGFGSKQVMPFRICVPLIRVKRRAKKP
jgi:hypothetical protein